MFSAHSASVAASRITRLCRPAIHGGGLTHKMPVQTFRCSPEVWQQSSFGSSNRENRTENAQTFLHGPSRGLLRPTDTQEPKLMQQIANSSRKLLNSIQNGSPRTRNASNKLLVPIFPYQNNWQSQIHTQRFALVAAGPKAHKKRPSQN